jgi:nucleoid-associated protein YgaU
MPNDNLGHLPPDVQASIRAAQEKAEKAKASQDDSSLPEQARAAMARAREGMLDAAGKAGAKKTAEKKEKTYTVVAGDSLSKIAKELLGDATRWPEIFELNKDQIENPDLIYPGQVFRLP